MTLLPNQHVYFRSMSPLARIFFDLLPTGLVRAVKMRPQFYDDDEEKKIKQPLLVDYEEDPPSLNAANVDNIDFAEKAQLPSSSPSPSNRRKNSKRNFFINWFIAFCVVFGIDRYRHFTRESQHNGHVAVEGYMRALNHDDHGHRHDHGRHGGHAPMSREKVEELFLSIPSNDSALAASRRCVPSFFLSCTTDCGLYSYTGFAHIGRA